jgi:hypothetical protein
MVAITERAMGGVATGRTLITVTGTEAELTTVLGVGTGLSDVKYKWNGDSMKIVWKTGVVGAVSVCYIASASTP